MPVVWCGGRSTGDARQASRRLAPRNAPLMIENKEDDEFWTELGGKTFDPSNLRNNSFFVDSKSVEYPLNDFAL